MSVHLCPFGAKANLAVLNGEFLTRQIHKIRVRYRSKVSCRFQVNTARYLEYNLISTSRSTHGYSHSLNVHRDDNPHSISANRKLYFSSKHRQWGHRGRRVAAWGLLLGTCRELSPQSGDAHDEALPKGPNISRLRTFNDG